MNKDLFPELSEVGKEEALKLIESFKTAITKASEDAIGILYTDVLPWVESDSWTNMRNQLLQALCGYKTTGYESSYWTSIRKKILEENYDEIIKDLDKDNLDRISQLEKQIEDSYRRF